MSNRDRISKENLLSQSSSQIFDIAIQEWKYTGEALDHGEATQQCQLCEHEQLRYHFQIWNHQTHQAMWVGSSCINKFRIRVIDNEGNLLYGKAAEKQLQTDLEKHQLERAKQPLRELYRQTDNALQKRIVDLVRKIESKGDNLSPNELLFLFKQMSEHSIPFPSYLYVVRIRSTTEKNELAEMSEAEYELVRPALSLEQQKRYPLIREKYELDQAKKEEEQQRLAAEAEQRRIAHELRLAERSQFASGRRPEAQKHNSSPERLQRRRYINSDYDPPAKPTAAQGPMEMNLATCTKCGTETRDWVIYNGDGTCTCRACSRKT